MNRTRLLFVVIISSAVLVIVGTLAWRMLTDTPGDAGLTIARPESLTIRVLTALPVEPWIRAAAEDFNAGTHTVDGVPIEVAQVPVVIFTIAFGQDADEQLLQNIARLGGGQFRRADETDIKELYRIISTYF